MKTRSMQCWSKAALAAQPGTSGPGKRSVQLLQRNRFLQSQPCTAAPCTLSQYSSKNACCAVEGEVRGAASSMGSQASSTGPGLVRPSGWQQV